MHVFPDASAMDSHFEGAAERSKAAMEYLTPLGWEIYGAASEAAIRTIREAAESAGVELKTAAQHLGGFLRLSGQLRSPTR